MINVYKPVFYRLASDADKSALYTMINSKNPIVFNTIESQLDELIYCRNPSMSKDEVKKQGFVNQHLERSGRTLENYGVWVYYSWKNQLVRVLEEEEFIEVRTNRNKYKITQEEQDLLRTKTIGIAGLSVGRAVATTIALERIAGEIRLADFDDLELSNLNRILAPLADIKTPKTISVAREIVEFDPYIKVICFTKGLTENSMTSFFTAGGNLDLFIEECDSLDIKVLSRLMAKELKIPVVMEASDRAVVDIERYDLEPDREILHGRLGGLNIETLKLLKSNEEKMPYMLEIVGYETLSKRIKSSMLEINQSITTWPQLSSAISYGGGLVANISRRILLDHLTISGRFFNDMEDQINNESIDISNQSKSTKWAEIEEQNWSDFVEKTENIVSSSDSLQLEDNQIKRLISDSSLATSIANSQPWKWIYRDNHFFLFLDNKLSRSFWDRSKSGARASLGAAVFNFEVSAKNMGFGVDLHPINIEGVEAVIALNDTDLSIDKDFFPYLNKRCTNRKKLDSSVLSSASINALLSHKTKGIDIQVISEKNKINRLSRLLGSLDRIRILNKNGHKDFYKEIIFDDVRSNLGIDANSLELSFKEYAGLRIAKDPEVASQLSTWGLGSGFDKISQDSVECSGGVCLVSIDKSKTNYLEGGRSIQKMWLDCTARNIAVHPITTAVFMFQLLAREDLLGLSKMEVLEIKEIREEFYSIFNLHSSNEEFFLFRTFEATSTPVKRIRRELNDILKIIR